jgi:hypothetical protein
MTKMKVALSIMALAAVAAGTSHAGPSSASGTFNGREWTRLAPTFPAAQRPRLELQVQGTPLRYEMTVEPSQLPLLPLLEMTPDLPGAAYPRDPRRQ